MLLAFVAGVGEDKIITSTCSDIENERLEIAAGIIENSPLYVKKMMDYSMQDIENAVKYAIREWNCHYIFYDYLHSSMKILSEINSRSGVSGLREDNVLFMIAARLKDICNQYRVFIMTATQLNGNFVNAEVLDQNVLRGAKSIADVCDVGMIMVNVTKADQEALKDTLAAGGYEMPQVKISVYKNRRGPYKDIILWCNADRGVCKINPVFITNNNYELQFINDTKIVVKR